MDSGDIGRVAGTGQRSRPRRPGPTVVRRFLILAGVGGAVLYGFLGATAYTEWQIATAGIPPGAVNQGTVVQAVGLAMLASVPVLLLAAVAVLYATRLAVAPLLDLAKTADEIARKGRARVPYLGRTDQIGDLAGALQGWQDAAAVRQIVLDRAPVGICRVDAEGQLQNVNLLGHTLLGYGRDQLEGRNLLDLVYPEDLEAALARRGDLLSARSDRTAFDGRFRRSDGTPLWCSVTVAPMRLEDGRPESYVLILQDVSARKEQAEQAAAFQRELLPKRAPRLHGYELAGACVPAEDVAGDLYDWTLTHDGHLDLTVADVMGKGMGAALVMARLQTALGTAPPELGPAARVAVADSSVTFKMDASEVFVTLFHARLELATGTLRYVDAGHGYCVLVRRGGEIVPLAGKSLPLGLGLGEVYHEQTLRLDRGDTLLVHSDGLVEVGNETTDERELVRELARAPDAEGMVRRLVERVSARNTDDVTALVLRRLAEPDDR